VVTPTTSSPTSGPSSSPTARPTQAPVVTPLTPGPTPNACPYQECIDRCIATYGGDGTSGPSYMCSKGCAGMSNGAVTNPNKFCDVEESERYSVCFSSCETASSNEDNKAYCRYGCEFWIVVGTSTPTKAPVVTPTTSSPTSGPSSSPSTRQPTNTPTSMPTPLPKDGYCSDDSGGRCNVNDLSDCPCSSPVRHLKGQEVTSTAERQSQRRLKKTQAPTEIVTGMPTKSPSPPPTSNPTEAIPCACLATAFPTPLPTPPPSPETLCAGCNFDNKQECNACRDAGICQWSNGSKVCNSL